MGKEMMKHSVLPNKEKGVVLILVLAILTMFAIMISAFLIVTSNMSDSAVNSLALYERGETVADRTETDLNAAVRTLLTGTNNESSPIGPFGILENLYGDQTTREGDDRLAVQNFNTRAVYENGKISKVIVYIILEAEAFQYNSELLHRYENRIEELRNSQNPNEEMLNSLSRALTDRENIPLAAIQREVADKILDGGNFLSFGRVQWRDYGGWENDPQAAFFRDFYVFFNETVSGSSAQILEKKVVRDGDVPVEVQLSVEPTESLKKFFDKFNTYADITRVWPHDEYSGSDLFCVTANLRLNPKPFSGTGAGGFTPAEDLDGQLNSEMAEEYYKPSGRDDEVSNFRLPFLFWGNASAPDTTPYLNDNGRVCFQTYWRRISDRDFQVYTQRGDTVFPVYNGAWDFVPESKVTPHDSVRMNPSYTALDPRTPFLSGLKQNGNGTIVTPSFVRYSPLDALSQNIETEAKNGRTNTDWLAVLRKMTPRPLQLDHWNWHGTSDTLSSAAPRELSTAGGDYRQMLNSKIQATISGYLTGKTPAPTVWDVDNDNDGVNDGIWIPSGLPIRTDENGIAYATMYSFTVLDMDGRVNVNTAGNWDQLPTVGTNFYNDLTGLAQAERNNDPNSPWYVFEKLEGGLGWMNDRDGNLRKIGGKRGTGLGPAEIDLADSFNEMKFSGKLAQESAARVLAARYSSPLYGCVSREVVQPDASYPLFDGLELHWLENDPSGAATLLPLRAQLRQPSAYTRTSNSDVSTWTPDDSDQHRRALLYTDAIYRGDENDNLADPNLFIFPWRGKTRVSSYKDPDGTKRFSSYPTFDFCDTALRSYDPLGNDILTYMPKYSENPYLVNPYGSTVKDSTFTAEMLETLLRPFDYDRKSRNTALLSALVGHVGGDIQHNLEKNPALRQEITTISSDIPVPSETFPVGIRESQDGVFGIKELIRHCVVLEFYKADLANGSKAFGDEFVTNAKNRFAEHQSLATKEGEREFRRYLREQIAGRIEQYKSGALDRITNQLFALLPKDIQEGRRLDLNALSRKACWLDSVYEESPDGKKLVKTKSANPGTEEEEEFEYYHRLGMVERMKFARGLYVLLMTLTYEDRNAETVAKFYDGDPDDRLTDDNSYKDYLEGCDKKYLSGLKAREDYSEDEDQTKSRVAAELAANRIAQYCVNLVDFTDPDAAMTPFFYDPNPFDGWWSYRDRDADWLDGDAQQAGEEEGEEAAPQSGGNDELFFVLHTPTTFAEKPECDFYDAFVPFVNGSQYFDVPEEEGRTYFFDSDERKSYFAVPETNNSYFSTPDAQVTNYFKNFVCLKENFGPVKFLESTDTFAQAFVSWLNGQSVDHTKIGEDDFGFRLVWGMERPDLLLTETLNFHDHGIADTKYEQLNGRGEAVEDGEDTDFDQVRRPLGSTYLELYGAANPNIPQSPELYRFDSDRDLWKLDLSKMTPRQGNDSPYHGLEFPIWRVAISASIDPRGLEEKDKEFTETNNDGEPTGVTYTRTVRKEKNSVAERIAGENADFRTFSLRTRQFCDLVQKEGSEKELDKKLDSKWRGYDYCVSNILGPSVAGGTKDGDPNYADEIEIDRIVWFGWPTASGKSEYDQIEKYPDAAHIFSPVKEGSVRPTYLFPNQYLVVAPSEKRWIGSAYKYQGYFGVPSSQKIDLTGLREEKSGKRTNSAVMLAGCYYGFDVNSDTKFPINTRGLNISEPLWFDKTDPYPVDEIPTKEIDYEGGKLSVTDLDRQTVPDHPFDLPAGNHDKDGFPIAADHLLGTGTVPGYRSAFVQRVADPNRPYHPSSNPYITVDWNMMDLTVFNGEANDTAYTQNNPDAPFYKGSQEEGENPNPNREIDEQNRILLKKSVFISADGKTLELDTDQKNTSSYFSSRGWLDPDEKGFLPEDLKSDHRPNPWARTVNKEELQKEDAAGLRKVVSAAKVYQDLSDLYTPLDTDSDAGAGSSGNDPNVVHIFPRHSLGAYNNPEHRVTELSSGIPELYYGAPSKSNAKDKFYPFEHLAWNDAPFSSPAEILLVPASNPGRFGFEFIRHKNVKDANGNDGVKLETLYTDGKKDDKYGKLGRSLGSDGGTGENLFGWTVDDMLTGPYLNFHHASNIRGESLNLSRVFDFVTIPSLYAGTRIDCGYDKNGDPKYVSRLREPGKINANTMKESGWNGILSDDEAATKFERIQSRISESGTNGNFIPFQPAHTAVLRTEFPKPEEDSDREEGEENDTPAEPTQRDSTWLAKRSFDGNEQLVDSPENDDGRNKKNNLYTATEELRKLTGLTTNRSNVFAVWLTVGYFKVERAQPGVNMPNFDPDGNEIPRTVSDSQGRQYLNLPVDYKYSNYYKAIYPDGYTYGKELGTGGTDTEGVVRPRAFYLIDRSIPVDFRRGRSWNWNDVILLERKL